MVLRPRPHSGDLHGEEALGQPSDAREGGWTKLQLLRMDERFAQALARAPEAPCGDGPDRVAEALLSRRRP